MEKRVNPKLSVPACLSFIFIILLFSACTTLNEGEPQISQTQLETGKTIYDSSCASCHGPNGEGQPNWRVPNEEGVLPAPPHDNTGHTWHHPDAQLLQVIAQGGSLPTSAMAGFADQLSEEEMAWTLAYIKTFWGPEELKHQQDINRRYEESQN